MYCINCGHNITEVTSSAWLCDYICSNCDTVCLVTYREGRHGILNSFEFIDKETYKIVLEDRDRLLRASTRRSSIIDNPVVPNTKGKVFKGD